MGPGHRPRNNQCHSINQSINQFFRWPNYWTTARSTGQSVDVQQVVRKSLLDVSWGRVRPDKMWPVILLMSHLPGGHSIVYRPATGKTRLPTVESQAMRLSSVWPIAFQYHSMVQATAV